MPGQTSESATTAAKDSSALIVASVVNGLAAYGYVVLGLRGFGTETFAPVAIIWSIWALSVAVTTFPLQHWINWRAEIDGSLSSVRAMLSRIGTSVVVVALVTASLAALTLPSLRTAAGWLVLAAALVVTAGVMGWGRGVLAAKGDYRGVAIAIGGENTIRLAVGALVVAAGGGVLAFGWALVAGPLVLVPLVRRLGAGHSGARVPIVSGLGGLSVAVLVAQVFVQMSPLAAEWLGAEAGSVSAVFATFALFRAPVLMGLAAVTRLTTPFTALFVEHRLGDLRRLVRWLTIAVAVGTPLAYLGSAALGPWMVRAIFGIGTDLAATQTGVVGAGMWLAIAGLALLVLHVASGSTVQAMVIWGIAGAAAVPFALAPGPVAGVVWAFGVGEVLAVSGSLIAHATRVRRMSSTG